MTARISPGTTQGITDQRPLTFADLPATLAIEREAERVEPTGELPDEEATVEHWNSPMVDLPSQSVGLFDGDDLVAYGLLTVVTDETVWVAYFDGGVDQRRLRQGLGTQVMLTLEELAERKHRAEFPQLPAEFRLSVPASRIGTAALASQFGYESWRYFFTLERDLQQPIEQSGEVDGLLIRPYTADDAEPARLARNAAFADHWGSLQTSPERWQANLIGSSAFRPEHSFVAECAGEPERGLAGFVFAEEFEADRQARGYRVGYIALVGTVREARGRGLASALLSHQLRSLADGGFRMAELNVDADSPTGAGRIYARAGFRQRWQTETRGKRIPAAVAGQGERAGALGSSS